MQQVMNYSLIALWLLWRILKQPRVLVRLILTVAISLAGSWLLIHPEHFPSHAAYWWASRLVTLALLLLSFYLIGIAMRYQRKRSQIKRILNA